MHPRHVSHFEVSASVKTLTDQQEAGQVSKSNELLLEMVNNMNDKERSQRVFWQSMPSEIDLKKHLADNAQLNRDGYAIWDKVLTARIEELLQ